jgi:two-component system chemotaxis response regulator CheB
MLVDDSAIVRGFMRRWIEEEPRVELVKVCSDGAQAVAEVANIRPDVIVLDIEMPNMDGLTALPHLRKLAPQAKIVMASTLTSAGAHQTVKALSLGAADFIAKPQASAMGAVDSYRRELIDKIIALGPRVPSRAGAASPAPVALRTRLAAVGHPSVMVVAASTGGPGALPVFLGQIARHIDVPILIVQHMPATFTPVFAEKLESAIGKRCREAVDGDVLAPGSVYLAPGDYHMRIARSPSGRIVTLDNWGDIFLIQMNQVPVVKVVIYFVTFIVLGTMIILNLFIGIIMNSMSEMHIEIAERERARNEQDTGAASLEDEFKTLESELRDLQMRLSGLRRKWSGAQGIPVLIDYQNKP